LSFLGREWQDVLKELNLKLWNKLPGDGRSNVGVSVMLEGWLPWCFVGSIRFVSIGLREARYVIFLSSKEDFYKGTV
jgi:hypothetical protein